MRGTGSVILALSASLLVIGPASAQSAASATAPPLAPAIASQALSEPPPALAPIPPAGARAPQATASMPAASTLAPAPALAPAPGARVAPQPAAKPAAAPTRAAAPAPARPPALTPARATPAPAPAPSRAPAPASQAKCDKPGALGVTRTVEIDTTGGPGFGFEHFRQHDFLRDREVVLTFDDGPWVSTTPHVLKALAEECVKATFFSIGKHATYYPEILRNVAAAGHTVGSHTWSHVDLSRKTVDEAKAEIEKAVSAVKWALGEQGSEAPFFRFPALRHPPEIVTYLGERNIAIFSTDMDSFDFKMRKPEQVINSVMKKLQKHGKGIVLLHDFQGATAHAVPELLAQLKAGGYKIVHMRARNAVASLPQFDEELLKDQKLPTVSQRPTSSVVRTVE
jgi:peptidoglycan/xylan/chitin deacetylase (PgdA/CDA1 family)